MVTYHEFKHMVLDSLQNVSNAKTVLYVNRLIAYTDVLVSTTPKPPVLPDIQPDSRPVPGEETPNQTDSKDQ